MSPLPKPPASPAPDSAPESTTDLGLTPEHVQELRAASMLLLGSFDAAADQKDLAMGVLAALERQDRVIRALNDVRTNKVVPTDKHLRELAGELRDATSAMLEGSRRFVRVLDLVESGRGRAKLRVVK